MRFLYPQAEAASLQALGHGICAKVAAATLEDAAAAFVSGLRDAGYDLGTDRPRPAVRALLGRCLRPPVVCDARWANAGGRPLPPGALAASYVPQLADRV
ncbi:hypothetical protein ANANG_G00072110, partial [Anguilla anguilla]